MSPASLVRQRILFCLIEYFKITFFGKSKFQILSPKDFSTLDNFRLLLIIILINVSFGDRSVA